MNYLTEKILKRIGEYEKKVLPIVVQSGEEGISIKEIVLETELSNFLVTSSLKELYKIGIVDRIYKNDLYANRNLKYVLDEEALEILNGGN